MKHLDEALKLHHILTGKDMPPEDVTRLLAVKEGIGIPDNDSLFAVFVALGYYLQMYREIPLEIANGKESIEKMFEDRLEIIEESMKISIQSAGESVIKHYQDSLAISKRQAIEEQKSYFLDAAKIILENNAIKINEKNDEAYKLLLEKEKTKLLYNYRTTLFISLIVALVLVAIGFCGGKYFERNSIHPIAVSK